MVQTALPPSPPRTGPQWSAPHSPSPPRWCAPRLRSGGAGAQLGSVYRCGTAAPPGPGGNGLHRADPPLRYGRGARRLCPLRCGRSRLDLTSPGRCSILPRPFTSAPSGAALPPPQAAVPPLGPLYPLQCLPSALGLPFLRGVPLGGGMSPLVVSPPPQHRLPVRAGRAPPGPQWGCGQGWRQRCCVESGAAQL